MKPLWLLEIGLVVVLWLVLYLGIKKVLARSKLKVLGKLATALLGFVALLLILQIIGFDVVPLITFGGIGAAAIGFASKDVISNFFGALMLYTTRPFTLGDLIELPDKHIMGNVEEIGWYHTAIRDPQKKPIYIPNSAFPVSYLINWSRITHRKIDEVFALRAEDAGKVPSIIESIRSLLQRTSAIDPHQPIFVFFQSYRNASLEIGIQAYTLSVQYDQYMEIKQQILLGAKQIIDQAGAELARPLLHSP